MKVTILDGVRFESMSSTHEYIKEKLGFPSYYGANLDALDDCLSELQGDTAVVIINRGVAMANLGENAAKILEVFDEILGNRGRCVII